MNYDYEEPKKWVKHTPSKKKTIPQKQLRAVNHPEPPINQDLLDNLMALCRLPNKRAYKRMDDLWVETAHLKSWLSRKNCAVSKEIRHWNRLKEILDHAIEERRIDVFDQFADAIKSINLKKKEVSLKAKARIADQKLASGIESLIPLEQEMESSNYLKLRILDLIDDIQYYHGRNAPDGVGRSPTQKEIREKDHQIIRRKNTRRDKKLRDDQISSICSELKITNLLSRE
jgi:hypothetical protein